MPPLPTAAATRASCSATRARSPGRSMSRPSRGCFARTTPPSGSNLRRLRQVDRWNRVVAERRRRLEHVVGPRSMPRRAYPGSHEGGSISATSPPQGSPPLLQSSLFESGSVVQAPRSLSKDFVRSAGLLTTAAAVVMILNVEPGGNVCCVATSPRAESHCCRAFERVPRRLGDDGVGRCQWFGVVVRIRVHSEHAAGLGSIATAAPSMPFIAARATCWSAGSSVNVTESAALVGASSCSNSAVAAGAPRENCCTPPQAPTGRSRARRSPRRPTSMNRRIDAAIRVVRIVLFDRVGQHGAVAARISPRGNCADGFWLRGLLGLAFSAGARKNWMFADCATMTAKSRRMIVARMRRRRDTDQPFFNVVVVDVVVVEEGIDALQLFA